MLAQEPMIRHLSGNDLYEALSVATTLLISFSLSKPWIFSVRLRLRFLEHVQSRLGL